MRTLALPIALLLAAAPLSAQSLKAPVHFANVPATPPGAQLDWVLDVLTNRHGSLEPGEIERRFAPSFLASVPATQVSALFAQLSAQLNPISITSADSDASKLSAHAVTPAAKLRISVVLDPATGKMAGLLFRPDIEDGPKLAGFDEAQKKLLELAPHAAFDAAALDHGTCAPLHGYQPKTPLALGSAFKLYVLLGLADQIATGKLTWETPIEVRDALKSLPSGVTQGDPAGTKLPIKTLAERMISISDNTAADLLLYLVGRKNVEAEVAATGKSAALDAPFLSTRELFLLKLGAAEERANYLKLSEAKRRLYLDETLAGKHPNVAEAANWKGARSIDKLEWFASGEDLCGLMGALWKRGQDPKTSAVMQVLSKNPGLPIDAKKWPYIGFKGGSEPGVLNLTYLLRRADDRWFFFEITLNSDEGGAVSEEKIIPLATAMIELLAKEP